MPVYTRETSRRLGIELEEMPTRNQRSRHPVESDVPGDAVPAESSPRGGPEGQVGGSSQRLRVSSPVESDVPGDDVPAESSPRGRYQFQQHDENNEDNVTTVSNLLRTRFYPQRLPSETGSIRSVGRRTGSYRGSDFGASTVKTNKSSELQRKLKADEDWAELQKQIHATHIKELEFKRKELEYEQLLTRRRQEVSDAESQDLSDEEPNEAYIQQPDLNLPFVPETSGNRKTNNWITQHTSEPTPLEALTQALTSAFQNIVPVPPPSQFVSNPTSATDMKQYMARQSTGRELPFFSGDPEEWQFFYATLTRTSKLCGFSEDENIARLQKCLKGKAKEAVQAMLVSTCSFDEIVGTLKKRFGQPKIIVKTLVEKARKATPPQEEDPESLMDFAIVVKNLCASAESLQQAQYLNNPQLMEELIMKLPCHMRMEWGRKAIRIGEEYVTLKDFSKFLDDVAAVAAVISSSSTKPSSTTAPPSTSSVPVAKKNEKKQSSYAAKEEKPLCASGCKKKHDLAACYKFKKMSLKERWDLVKSNKLCFICLESGHSKTACPLQKQCEEEGCGMFHHRLLHYNGNRTRTENRQASQPDSPSAFSGNVQKYPYDDVLMRVLPVRLSGPNGSFVVNAFLDEGSSVSMIDEELATQLGTQGEKKPLNLSWINGNSNADMESMSVTLKISGISNSNSNQEETFRLFNVRTVKNLYLPSQPLQAYKMRKTWEHLKEVPFSNIGSDRPKLLLGQDNIRLTVPRKVIEGSHNSPVATLTKLGWVVHGKTVKRECFKNGHVSFAAFKESQDDELHELVKEQFRLDSLGIMSNQKVPRSKEDEHAEDLMKACTKRVGDHWETGLLWKNEDLKLPDSKPAAQRRLRILEKQMDKDSTFADLYCKKIEEYIEKDFCHKLSPSELAENNGKIWYLPHFGTRNPNKPGKLRLI